MRRIFFSLLFVLLPAFAHADLVHTPVPRTVDTIQTVIFGASLDETVLSSTTEASVPEGTPVTISYTLNRKAGWPNGASDWTEPLRDEAFAEFLDTYQVHLELWSGVPFTADAHLVQSWEVGNALTGNVSAVFPADGPYFITLYIPDTYYRHPEIQCADEPIEDCDPAYALDDMRAFFTTPLDASGSKTLGLNMLGLGMMPFSVEAAESALAPAVLFIPGTESSRLYMRDFFGVERQLWEPSIKSDVQLLAMNEDGTSVHNVYTKDIIDTIFGNEPELKEAINAALGKEVMVYGDFETFMDGLVDDGTIASWRAYPYDWRYGIDQIVDDGALTEQSDDSLERVYLEQVVEDMASTTSDHKITIVAHSNGGLIAKDLIMKLEDEGKAGLVERLVLIGTPQWGTPKSIGSLLHGDDSTIAGGIVMYGGDVRETAEDMPGPYDLLPSPAYFSNIAGPVATFADDAKAGPLATAYGAIDSFARLFSFVTDESGAGAASGFTDDLKTPLPLRTDLVSAAGDLHERLDAWSPPDGLSVTSIVGWGQPTPYAYRYESVPGHLTCLGAPFNCSRPDELLHTPLFTEDGDGTVIAQSAAADTANLWYFNAKDYGDAGNGEYVHRYLTSAPPIQEAVQDAVLGAPLSGENSGVIKPNAPSQTMTRIGGLSPINVLVSDDFGNRTGIVAIPGKPDLYFGLQEIPGSVLNVSGDEKFVYIPPEAEYQVSVAGYAAGTANIQIADMNEGGEVISSTTIADIPVTSSTTAAFSISQANEVSRIAVDTDGNGSSDQTIQPVEGELISDRSESSEGRNSDSGSKSTTHHSDKIGTGNEVNTATSPTVPTMPATDSIEIFPMPGTTNSKENYLRPLTTTDTANQQSAETYDASAPISPARWPSIAMRLYYFLYTLLFNIFQFLIHFL